MTDYEWPKTVEEAAAAAARKVAEGEDIGGRLDAVELALSDSSLQDADRHQINRHLTRLKSILAKTGAKTPSLLRGMEKLTQGARDGRADVQKAEELLKLSNAIYSRIIRHAITDYPPWRRSWASSRALRP